MLTAFAAIAALSFRASPQNFARISPARPFAPSQPFALARTTPPRACASPEIHTYKASVYIEDTDCFSVVYYANYLKYFERAALDLLGAADCQALFAERGLLLGAESFDTMKFAAPGRLGDDVEVRTTVAGFDGGTLRLDAALVRAGDGAELCSCGGLRVGFRLRDDEAAPLAPWPESGRPAEVAAAAAAAEAAGGGAAPTPPPSNDANPGPFVLQADEASAHGRFSLHAAMRYFERTRTGSLGGPAALAELQDAGVQVVVARATNARLLRAAATTTLGAPCEVRCGLTLRARDTQVVFDQHVLSAATGEPLAAATVTCLCVDPVAGKMVPAPAALKARLEPFLS